ncbi:MAG: hypothetical protein ABI432_05300 [Flavobacteriales bacterium]
MTRSLLLLLGVGSCVFASAQAFSVYELRSEPALDARGIKFLHATVHAIDDHGQAWVYEDRIKVRLHDDVNLESTLEALSQATGTTFTLVHSVVGGERSTAPEPPPGFPVPHHTGNIAQDAADDTAAKQAWREANPELYQEYLESLRQRTPASR